MTSAAASDELGTPADPRSVSGAELPPVDLANGTPHSSGLRKRRAVDCLLLYVSAGLVLAACGDGIVHHVPAGSLPLASGLHRDASIEEKDASDGGLGQRLYARFDIIVSDTQTDVGAKVAEETFLRNHGWRRDRSVPPPSDTLVSPDGRLATWLETTREIATDPANRSAYYPPAVRRRAAAIAGEHLGALVAGLEAAR